MINVYMAVTTDKYELPIAVADTVKELSELTGTSKNAISSAICKKKSGRISGKKFIRVEIDETENEDE